MINEKLLIVNYTCLFPATQEVVTLARFFLSGIPGRPNPLSFAIENCQLFFNGGGTEYDKIQ